MNIQDLQAHHPELERKIYRTRNLKGRVRKITNEEAQLIKNIDEYRDGYFPYAGTLIAMERRENGQHVIFEI